MTVPVIGLLGGVGSGKSSVARQVQQIGGIVIVDGDQAGHEVLNQSSVQKQLIQRFGKQIFDREKEQIDRRALAEMVFGTSAEQKQSRADLEQIVHPQIREMLANKIEQGKALQTVDAILLDAAVMLEAGWDDLCDRIVFVDVPRETRLSRVRESRGWDEAEFDKREASQWSLETKRQASDDVIDNSQTVEHAGIQLRKVIDKIREASR